MCDILSLHTQNMTHRKWSLWFWGGVEGVRKRLLFATFENIENGLSLNEEVFCQKFKTLFIIDILFEKSYLTLWPAKLSIISKSGGNEIHCVLSTPNLVGDFEKVSKSHQ